MVKKGIEPNPAHKTYLIVGVSLIVLVLLLGVYSFLFVAPKGAVVGKATAIAPTCAKQPSGIISWWRGEGNADDFMDRNDGTTTGSDFGYAAGIDGQAFNFDGVDDSVRVTTANTLKLVDAISIEAWVKSNDRSGYKGAGQLVSNYRTYILGSGDNNNKVCFIFFPKDMISDASKAEHREWTYDTACYEVPDPNKWHHFVATFDSRTQIIALYVDGDEKQSTDLNRPVLDTCVGTRNLDGTCTGTPTNIACTDPSLEEGNIPCKIDEIKYTDSTGKSHSTDNLCLGCREPNDQGDVSSYPYFSGLIDEPTIYNRALTAGEVKELYDAGMRGYGKCAEETGDLCKDGDDNDGDGNIDCQEGMIVCGCNFERKETTCTDSRDNDLDGLFDCEDEDCNGKLGMGGTDDNCEFDKEKNCRDGFDNDGNTLTDCQDSDCGCRYEEGKEASCNDKFDNDLNGKFDCGDVNCSSKRYCEVKLNTAGTAVNLGLSKELSCHDNFDNDGDCNLDSNNDQIYCGTGDNNVDCKDTDCTMLRTVYIKESEEESEEQKFQATISTADCLGAKVNIVNR